LLQVLEKMGVQGNGAFITGLYASRKPVAAERRIIQNPHLIFA
jgi:hypothetical protein